MDNHFHALVETPEPNLSEGMQLLNGIYAQEFNAIVGRTGHLFQGRYYSVRIQREEQLLETARYVVLNRVRCRAVADPRTGRGVATPPLPDSRRRRRF
jgi:REP element-mobilizing transposase RayT